MGANLKLQAMEYAPPVWHPNLTQTDSDSIERVQKTALKLVLQKRYLSYKTALNDIKLESLFTRRERLCMKFALKAESHPKFTKWFKEAKNTSVTREIPKKYCKVFSRKVKYDKSPLSYLTNLLNSYHSKSS